MRFLTCGLGITVLFSMALIGRCAGAQPSPAAPPLVQKAPLPEPESQPVVSLVQPTGTAADVVAPELIQLLADPNWEKRIWAADHLGKLGPEAKVAVPALIALLKDGEPAVRQAAADALGRLGPAAAKAAPDLAALLRDPTWAVRSAAATALVQAAVEVKKYVAEGNPGVTPESVSAIIGPEVKAAVAVATAALDDPRFGVRRLAANVLGGIGPHAGGRSGADQVPGRRGAGGADCGRGSTHGGVAEIGCGAALGRETSSRPASGRASVGCRLVGTNRGPGEALDPSPDRNPVRPRIPGADCGGTRVGGDGPGCQHGVRGGRRAGA